VLDLTPIPTGDPRSIILDSAQAWPADLIVLGSHGRRGSVAVHAHCSVEVIRRQEDTKH
jgi:Universal stress protein family